MLPDGIYKVITPNYEFLLRIVSADDLIQLQYGDATNQEGPCMELSYDLNIPAAIQLENMMYGKRCSVDGELQKGTGTVEMLRSMITICNLLMPSAKRMYFKDVSDSPCNDRRMLLAHYSLLLYGQTWYERHFKAVMKNKAYRDRLDDFRQLLKSKPKEGVFHGFRSRLIQKHATWHDLFHDLFQTHGCTALVGIQDQIFKIAGLKLYYSDWYIPLLLQKDNIPIKITKVSKNRMDGGTLFQLTGKMQFTKEDLHSVS